MVDPVATGALAHEAILAAMKAQANKAGQVQRAAQAVSSGAAAPAPPQEGPGEFAEKLSEAVAAVDERVRGIDELPRQLASGEVGELHEVAVRIKEAELSFRFAMEIRNKLIDAYREVMRMSV